MSTRDRLSRFAGVGALSAALFVVPSAPAVAANTVPGHNAATMRTPARTRGSAGGTNAVLAQNGGAATESTSGNSGAGQNSGIATTNGSGAGNSGGGGGLWGLIGLIGLLGLLGLRRQGATARSGVVTTTSAPPR